MSELKSSVSEPLSRHTEHVQESGGPQAMASEVVAQSFPQRDPPFTKNSKQSAKYSIHPSLERFSVPYKTYLSNVPEDSSKITYQWVIVGAIVFDLQDRILLIQRAAKEFLPNLWETPGGSCEADDESIVYSAVRELKEETGLQATSVEAIIGNGYHFPLSTGKMACKHNFLVKTADQAGEEGMVEVRLDPNEHQNYVWATEPEVTAGKVGDIEIKFTSLEQEKAVLDAFKLGRELKSGVA